VVRCPCTEPRGKLGTLPRCENGCLTQPFLLLQGGPGSGKGTQCEKLVQKYGFTHICAAELVRNELASASERSLLIREPLERGDPVPVDIVLELLKDAMAAHLGEDTKVFLIEGYPQEVKQGEEFERRIGQPHLVICMECSADTMTSRLLQRNPDDRAEAVTQRIQTYYQALVAMTAHYEKNTQLHKVSLTLLSEMG
uniref:Adenylate kinase 5 n=1 Tax=Vombatus ursinus TaxID=29139 RepID=A0A4X2KXA8_VOMUR